MFSAGIVTILVVFCCSYFLGSVPFGLVLTRLFGLGDIRSIGSGNIGATNVLRTGNRTLAALTLLCDTLKGTLAVLVAKLAGFDLALIAALGAFLGHLFPVWLKFRGGKGVATFLGCLIALSPEAALGFAGIWMLAAFLFRYSSLAALTASCATPPILLIMDKPLEAELFLVLALLLWWKHKENIKRLIAGTESRIGKA